VSTTKTTGAGLAVKLIGTCEAARILGVHRNTIRHWAENGILRARVLPTGARRFDPGEVERLRAETIDVGERQILVRVERGGILIGERELRYQLERKDSHLLAQSDELLDVLAEIEARGLIEAELCFRLTARGRELLAEPEPERGCER
jgi:DNA-binding transcriptional MerR regulator